MPDTSRTAPADEASRTFHRIRHALAQVEPWDYTDCPTRAYQRGWSDASRWIERVLTATENCLLCASCGMPAHRGAGKIALDALMPSWATPPDTPAEPTEHDEVARLGQIIAKLQRRIASVRRRSKRQYDALKRLPDLRRNCCDE